MYDSTIAKQKLCAKPLCIHVDVYMHKGLDKEVPEVLWSGREAMVSTSQCQWHPLNKPSLAWQTHSSHPNELGMLLLILRKLQSSGNVCS